ncbi:MAG TPA: CsgG/HfaB family protein [Spirochaetota bacterium]|nr:CsgG/HfaB family protein [Spirochaetota bacterium]
MKSIVVHIFISAFILIFCATSVYAQNKMRIAVMDLTPKRVKPEVAMAIADIITGEVVKAGTFTVLERSQIKTILDEQGFQQTGCTDQECAVQIGRLLSASNIITGEVSKVGNTILITVRVVDVEKGVSEFAATEMAATEDALVEAAMKLTAKLTAQMESKLVPPGRVKATDAAYDDRVVVTWDIVGNAELYYVYRYDPEKGLFELVGKTKYLTYADTDAQGGVVYSYKVKAWSAKGGFSEFSNGDAGSIKARGITRTGYYLRAIVPGWAHFYAGQSTKGYAFAGGFLLTGALAYYTYSDYTSKKAAYEKIGEGYSQETYDKKFTASRQAALYANIGIGLFALSYVANWVDVLWFTKPVFGAGPASAAQGGAYFDMALTHERTAFMDDSRVQVFAGYRF